MGMTQNDSRGRIMGMTQNAHTVYVYIQEGGASAELYLHVFDTYDDADAGRVSSAEASYRTTDIVVMPASTDWDAVQALVGAIGTLDYPAGGDDRVHADR